MSPAPAINAVIVAFNMDDRHLHCDATGTALADDGPSRQYRRWMECNLPLDHFSNEHWDQFWKTTWQLKADADEMPTPEPFETAPSALGPVPSVDPA